MVNPVRLTEAIPARNDMLPAEHVYIAFIPSMISGL